MVSILFLSSFKQNCSASFCDSVSEALNKKRMLVEESPHNDSFLPNILAAHLHAEKTFCLIIWWFLGFCLGHSTGDSGGHSECTEWCSAGTWTWGCKDSRKCGRSTDTRTAHGTLIIVRYAIVGRRLYGTLFYLTTPHYGQISFSWWLWNPSSKIVMHLNHLLTAACSSAEFSKCHSTLYQTLRQFSIWDEVPFLFVTWTQITWHKFLYPWSLALYLWQTHAK